MDFTYSEKEVEYARFIRNNSPVKIWWNFCAYTFDYGEFYFQIECISEKADSQNSFDEAVIGRFTKVFEVYDPTTIDELIVENTPFSEVYIVRTFLYFTDYREFTNKEISSKVERLESEENKDPFEKIVATAMGGNSEIICNPDSEAIKNVNPTYSNLIDCGLLLQINGKMLKTFVEENAYGFHIWNDKYFFDLEELKWMSPKYKLIKV